MQPWLLILLHLTSSLGKFLKPGGAKALVAENFLLRHQLLILRRARQRAPNLRFSDRLLFGLGSLFLRPRRLLRAAILIKPSTLLRCHRALAELKLKWLYSSGPRHKPGPKGPGEDLIQAIIELKRRNLWVAESRSERKSNRSSAWGGTGACQDVPMKHA